MFNIRIPFFSSGNGNYMNQMPGGWQINGKAGGVIALLIGLVFVAVGAFMVYDDQQTKGWPTTTGTVQEVRTETRFDSDGNSRTVYRYKVVYTVGGKSYSSAQSSEQYVMNNNQVNIAYNSGNPGDIRMRNGADWLAWVFVVVGALVMILGIFGVVKGGSSSSVTPAQPAMNGGFVPGVPQQQPAPSSPSPVADYPTTTPSVSPPPSVPSSPASPPSTPTPPSNYPPQPPTQSN